MSYTIISPRNIDEIKVGDIIKFDFGSGVESNGAKVTYCKKTRSGMCKVATDRFPKLIMVEADTVVSLVTIDWEKARKDPLPKQWLKPKRTGRYVD